jgi:predicted transcriptional regulator with HTH domain
LARAAETFRARLTPREAKSDTANFLGDLQGLRHVSMPRKLIELGLVAEQRLVENRGNEIVQKEQELRPKFGRLFGSSAQ